jgi:hypothetical protein
VNTFSLQEYHQSCPAAAVIPTVTQSGLIGPILARRHRKALRKMRRRVRLERLQNLLVKPFVRLWGFFTALFQRGSAIIFISHLTPQNKTP